MHTALVLDRAAGDAFLIVAVTGGFLLVLIVHGASLVARALL
jgi:hypothetical protein